MDLKQGLELLKSNKTFKSILSTLLSIGIFLNGAPVKGFQVEYLAKVRVMCIVREGVEMDYFSLVGIKKVIASSN